MSYANTQSSTLPFADFLRTWLYLPTTIWRDTFESFYHPQLFLGCNIQDRDDEYNVLNEVGSYGKQISQIQKILDVYIAHLPDDLSPEEKVSVEEYRAYSARVAAALTESRGPRATELTTGYVKRLETALNTKRSVDKVEFDLVLEQLKLLLERMVHDNRQR